ncbi:MAG: hypothetical protein WA085_13265 [Sphingobium sp.]
MTTATRPKSRKPERLLFTVGKGALLPADGYTAKRLRERQYKMGDHLLVDLRKPRNPGFHRLAHRLGMLVAENIDDFEGLDGHAVLKRLQIEANVECDEIPLFLEMLGQKIKISHRVPRSLSYASMGEDEFKATIRRISNYIAETYWPGLTADQIELMAESMPESA